MSLDERARRVLEAAREAGGDCAVLTSPGAVAYSTGYPAPLGLGASPFGGGPATALLAGDGGVALVLPDVEAAGAEARPEVEVASYPSFFADAEASAAAGAYLDAVAASTARLGFAGAVAAERDSLPAALAERLVETVAIGPALAAARATKTATELEALREAARVAGVGQDAVAAALRPGATELELFVAARGAIEAELGRPAELELDLLGGVERSAAVLGGPSGRALAAGEPLLVDLVPRVGAYWGDSCATLAVGELPAEAAAMHACARRALERAAAELRPGLAVAELAASIRGEIEAGGYEAPIHAGHGIGTDNVEPPRIVPGSAATLREGAVVMLEPCARRADLGGVRVERMYAITATGAEDFSTHDLGPEPTAGFALAEERRK